MKPCGRKCEVYSRAVGFYRPTAFWNAGKLAELAERKPFEVKRV